MYLLLITPIVLILILPYFSSIYLYISSFIIVITLIYEFKNHKSNLLNRIFRNKLLWFNFIKSNKIWKTKLSRLFILTYSWFVILYILFFTIISLKIDYNDIIKDKLIETREIEIYPNEKIGSNGFYEEGFYNNIQSIVKENYLFLEKQKELKWIEKFSYNINKWLLEKNIKAVMLWIYDLAWKDIKIPSSRKCFYIYNNSNLSQECLYTSDNLNFTVKYKWDKNMHRYWVIKDSFELITCFDYNEDWTILPTKCSISYYFIWIKSLSNETAKLFLIVFYIFWFIIIKILFWIIFYIHKYIKYWDKNSY